MTQTNSKTTSSVPSWTILSFDDVKASCSGKLSLSSSRWTCPAWPDHSRVIHVWIYQWKHVKTYSHWWYPKMYHIILPLCLHEFTKWSFDQLTASSSSIIASLSSRLACSHFWWISGGTLHRPLGFFSQRRRNRFCLAPSVAGGGRSGGGATGPFFLAPEEEEDSFGCGVLAGVGPETLGGGVCKALFLSEDFFLSKHQLLHNLFVRLQG